eukprot:1155898-Pelagomonas_calceolata.AAC.1
MLASLHAIAHSGQPWVSWPRHLDAYATALASAVLIQHPWVVSLAGRYQQMPAVMMESWKEPCIHPPHYSCPIEAHFPKALVLAWHPLPGTWRDEQESRVRKMPHCLQLVSPPAAVHRRLLAAQIASSPQACPAAHQS